MDYLTAIHLAYAALITLFFYGAIGSYIPRVLKDIFQSMVLFNKKLLTYTVLALGVWSILMTLITYYILPLSAKKIIALLLLIHNCIRFFMKK